MPWLQARARALAKESLRHRHCHSLARTRFPRCTQSENSSWETP